jgi:uridine kinase
MRVTVSIKRNSFLIGVSGGSGSGKTYFAQALQAKLGADVCEIISQDNYYIDQSQRFDFDGGSVNFDHPDSIDFKLLASHLAAFRRGETVDVPIYDFVTHSRLSQTIRMKPKPVIIIDGILIFHPVDVRNKFDDLIYFDTSEDIRFTRRLERDTKERGREPEGVRNQFFKQVKPMHDQFVEPCKAHAKSVVFESENFDDVLNERLSEISKMISNINSKKIFE